MRHAMPRRHVWRWVALGLAVVVLGVTGFMLSRAQSAVNTSTEGGSAIDILLPQALDGERTGTVNILLAGSSFDEQGHDGATLTDSIMVASMNLSTNRMTVVSIPRDLWINDGGKEMKINSVFTLHANGKDVNDLGDYRAGMSALGRVAEKVTGLRIDHFVLVGYSALKDSVDAVGGIDVNVKGTEGKGIFDNAAHINLPEGWQHIDGTTALGLSRARNDKQVEGNEKSYGVSDSDFGRTRNQRVVMAALLDKVKSTPALANPATMLAMFDVVSTNVRTDLSVGQVRRVFDLSTHSSGMNSITIKGDAKTLLLADYTNGPTATARSSLVPSAGPFDYSKIRKYIAASINS